MNKASDEFWFNFGEKLRELGVKRIERVRDYDKDYYFLRFCFNDLSEYEVLEECISEVLDYKKPQIRPFKLYV